MKIKAKAHPGAVEHVESARPLFSTISDADWARAIRAARLEPNRVREHIHAQAVRRADVLPRVFAGKRGAGSFALQGPAFPASSAMPPKREARSSARQLIHES